MFLSVHVAGIVVGVGSYDSVDGVSGIRDQDSVVDNEMHIILTNNCSFR